MSAGTRKGALILGLILIGIGLAFFLSNWYSTLTAWQLIARYWPVLLILIGVRKLYCYFTYCEEPAPADPAARRHRRRCPSLLGGLLWIGIGTMFLLKNFGIGPDLWSMARRYWPILLILLGLAKVVDYFRQKEGVSLRIGEVFGILIVLIIGLAITQIPGSAVRDLLSSSINIGGTDVFLGTSHEYTQDFTYPLTASLPVRIENSNGTVTVSPGSDSEVRIHMRERVYEDDEARARQIADEIKIQGGVEGAAGAATLVVRTNRDDLSAKNYHFNTDMDVYVPKHVVLDIRNSFGGVNVSGLDCKLNVQSSQQLTEVRECSGSFVVENQYGESRLTSLAGNLSVHARGRVTVETVKGDVDIHDEYEPVTINDVEGKVTVSDEEANITVSHVTKPVSIDAHGCQVTVSNLQASVHVTSSHRRVQITDVVADAVLVSEYGIATVRRVKGNVDLTSTSDRISLDDIGGYLKATAQGSSLNVNTVGGPVEIHTTMRDVIVNNFSKGCKVTNEYGDVTLSTESLGKDDISVKDRNGDITLFLPPTAAFQLDATARKGSISTDFAGLEPLSGSGDVTTTKGRTKAGGPKIVLETENKDIYVRARTSEQPSARNK